MARISPLRLWFPAAIVLLLPIAPAAAEPDYSKDPVLFVHGYFLGDAGTWSYLKKRLVEQGWPEEYLFSFQFDDVFGCNPKHGEEIEAHAQELMAWTGRDRFDIVCHSMGCVDSRWWIRHMCGYGRVNDFVSIAGANQGSVVACLEPMSCGADQLCVGSGEGAWKDNLFLLELNECDMTPYDPIRYTSIWTSLDEIVVPSTNAVLDGAVNIEVEAVVGHALILSNEETVGHLVAALDGGGKNDNVAAGPQPCVDLCDGLPIEPGPEAGDVVEEPGASPDSSALPTDGASTPDAGGDLREPGEMEGSDSGQQGMDSGVPEDGRAVDSQGAEADSSEAPPLHPIRRSDGGCRSSGAGLSDSPGAQSSALLVLLLSVLSSWMAPRILRARIGKN